MNLEKLTFKSQENLASAIKKAGKKKNPQVTSLHLLSAMIEDKEGVVIPILEKLKVDPSAVKQEVDRRIEQLPKLATEGDHVKRGENQPYISSELGTILEKGESEAKRFGDEYLSQEVLFLALLLTDCQAGSILKKYKIRQEDVRKVIKTMRGTQKATDQNPEGKYQALEKYTIDLTKQAKEGKLDPVIGRDEEIRRVMQILARRTKNNPVLIGDPGVGKTAIAEGLAQRIATGDVAENLKNKKVLMLDLAAMLAGSKFRGEFEERLKAVLSQIKKAGGTFIVFIDELHTLVGAGAAEGAVDASNMLKPALARGELRAIGATTLNEYRQYIEKDGALERRFQPVIVNAPSVEETIAILRGLKEKYEVHHGVKITDDALIAAATLSDRYIADRFLPDKAIDLIDEAGSSLRIETESMPESLDELARKITEREIELAALKREKGKETTAKAKDLKARISTLKEKFRKLKLEWENQKEIFGKAKGFSEQIDKLKIDLERAERDVDLEKAAKIKYGELPKLEEERRTEQKKLEKIPKERRLLRQKVTVDDIAAIVSRWTGIPVTRLLVTEAKKLADLEKKIHQRLVDQDDAVKEVANAIRRSRAGISEENRPIGSFLFLGPTGVGKTELAKTLAEVLFDDERAMIRIDMSEYQEEHTVARLIGAPPGYVGYEEGGQLTEAVRRKPYSVLLFDEIEKAHGAVFNLFLQIMDEGRLTDGKGRTVNFKNTILIMTSNIAGSAWPAFVKASAFGRRSRLRPTKSAGKQVVNDKKLEQVKQEVWEEVKRTFKPEFINRLDQIVLFEPLKPAMLDKIVELQLQKVKERLGRQKISLEFTQKVKEYLVKKGYDPTFGARPLKRLIQAEILDKLALEIVEGKIKEGEKIKVDLKNNKLVFS